MSRVAMNFVGINDLDFEKQAVQAVKEIIETLLDNSYNFDITFSRLNSDELYGEVYKDLNWGNKCFSGEIQLTDNCLHYGSDRLKIFIIHHILELMALDADHWDELAYYMNKEYNYNLNKNGEDVYRNLWNYMLVCPSCKHEKPFNRMCKTVLFPSKCKCKNCGTPYVRIR